MIKILIPVLPQVGTIRTFDHKAPVWVQCRVKMSRDHQEHVCSTGHKAFVDTSVRWHRHECNCVRSARRRRPGKTRAAKAVRSRGVAWLSSTQSQGGQTLMADCGSGGSRQVLHTLYVWPLGLVGACAQPNWQLLVPLVAKRALVGRMTSSLLQT